MTTPTTASVLRRVEAEEDRRKAGDAAIRKSGKGVAIYANGWPERPEFASVEWVGPKGAGEPAGAVNGDTLVVG